MSNHFDVRHAPNGDPGDLDPFDGVPADTMHQQVSEPAPEPAWGVLIVYPHIGSRLLGFDTERECKAFVAASQRECYVVSVPVPVK